MMLCFIFYSLQLKAINVMIRKPNYFCWKSMIKGIILMHGSVVSLDRLCKLHAPHWKPQTCHERYDMMVDKQFNSILSYDLS